MVSALYHGGAGSTRTRARRRLCCRRLRAGDNTTGVRRGRHRHQCCSSARWRRRSGGECGFVGGGRELGISKMLIPKP